MSAVTLALAASLTLSGAAALAMVGRSFSRRAERTGSGDLRLFALLWHGLAGALVADAALTLLALASWAPLPVVVAIMDARLLFPILALYGFAGYLTVVYFGTRRWLLPLAVPLTVVYLATLGTAAAFELRGILVQEWRGWYDFARVPEGTLYSAADAANFLPPLVLSVVYARLFGYAHDPHARWRIAVLSPSLAGYFAGQYFGLLDFLWQGFSLLQAFLALGLAGAAWVALRPPAWAQRRLQRAPWTATSTTTASLGG